MPWESTWFIFSCNPLVHSSLSNRNTFCRNDESLTNEFRRSVAHIIRLKDPKKSPRKSSAPWINKRDQLQCDLIAAIQVWWLYYDKNTLWPWWVDPLNCPHFIFIFIINIWPSLSLSLLRRGFSDTSRWNLQSRDPHWSLPNQSGSYGFQWRRGWLFPSVQGSTYLAQPILLRMVEKIFTLKETSKGHLARSPHGRWRSPGIAKNHQCSTLRSSCACILSLQLNFLSCHVHTSALLQ